MYKWDLKSSQKILFFFQGKDNLLLYVQCKVYFLDME